MLLRQVMGFLPSQVVPALASFAGIYLFTHEATPEQYGIYALVMSVVLMVQSVLFYWVQVAVVRHADAAQRGGSLLQLRAAAYRCHLYTWAAVCVVHAVAMAWLPLQAGVKAGLWFGLGLVALRSLVVINQAFNRGALRTWRYNAIEAGHALGQLALGWLLLHSMASQSLALLGGVLLAAAMACVADLPAMALAWREPVDVQAARKLLRFGLPLSLGFGLNYVLATSDRMLVQYYLGAEAVGVYSVAYGLMDRAVSAVFIAISMASYPLAIRAFEQGGAQQAREQMRRSGELLLLVSVPTAALLMCLNQQIAAVMVGPQFRDAAAQLMPWVAAAALLGGFQVHFFDHAFHLEKRTALFAWTLGPAALANLAANAVLLPRFGLQGAAWATLLGYGLALALSMAVGARVFKVPLALGQVLRALAAAAAMSAVLQLAQVPGSVAGLLAGTALAAMLYLPLAWMFNLAGLRERARQRWASRAAARPAA